MRIKNILVCFGLLLGTTTLYPMQTNIQRNMSRFLQLLKNENPGKDENFKKSGSFFAQNNLLNNNDFYGNNSLIQIIKSIYAKHNEQYYKNGLLFMDHFLYETGLPIEIKIEILILLPFCRHSEFVVK